MFRCKIFLSNVMDSSVFFIFAVVVVGVLAIVFKFSLLCSSHCVLILVVEVFFFNFLFIYLFIYFFNFLII